MTALPRNFLLVLALKLTTAAAVNDAPPTYGFFGRTEGASDTTTSSTTTTTTSTSNSGITTTTTRTEECTGFGCREEHSLSQDDADRGERGFHQSLGSCTPVSLEINTDSRPQDVSFELVCNGANVWTYPSALIPQEGAHGQIRVSACVFLEHSCCHFALHDSHGDGLSSGDNDNDHSSMQLQVDGQVALKYNSQHDLPFTSLAKSFGKTCSATPQVNVTPKDRPQDVDCQMGVDRPLNFRITLDEHPEDLSWFLVCQSSESDSDGELVTVWDTPRGSLAGHVGQVAAEKACIPYDSTCSFTIVDAAGDGLSKGSGYTLTLGVGLIDAYVSEPFQEKSYCIGPKCGKSFETSDNADAQEEEETATEAPEEQDLSVEEPEEEEAEPHDEELEEEVIVSKTTNEEPSEEEPATGSDAMKDEFEKELEKLEDQEEEQEMLLEKLRESNEQRQQAIELLQEELEEEEALEKKVEQEQQQQTPPPQPEEPLQAQEDTPSAAESNTEDLLLQEEVETLEEEERSFQAWILAGLGIVCFLFVAVAGVALNMSSNRHSVAVRVALSPMKNGMVAVASDTDDESTELDDHTFCLDA